MALAVLSLGACSADRVPAEAAAKNELGEFWDGEIQQWGAMREVLAKGKTEGRVRLRDFAGSKGVYAIGALAGLNGEVTILDGEVWVSRVRESRADCRLLEANDTQATLLVMARVSRWTEHPITEDVSAENMEAFIKGVAEEAGLDVSRPFPFLVEGPFAKLDAHIANGMCPMRADPNSDQAPIRFHLDAVRGTLVGLHALGQEGVLTHHGSKTHVHVVIGGDQPQMGHVESIELMAGSVLKLPAQD